MATKRDVYKKSALAAGDTAVRNLPVIPSGYIWIIKDFGAVDLWEDDKGSLYLLHWGSPTAGWELIKVISASGATHEVTINREFVGDGDKRFRIRMTNRSAVVKDMYFWLEAYERE